MAAGDSRATFGRGQSPPSYVWNRRNILIVDKAGGVALRQMLYIGHSFHGGLILAIFGEVQSSGCKQRASETEIGLTYI